MRQFRHTAQYSLVLSLAFYHVCVNSPDVHASEWLYQQVPWPWTNIAGCTISGRTAYPYSDYLWLPAQSSATFEYTQGLRSHSVQESSTRWMRGHSSILLRSPDTASCCDSRPATESVSESFRTQWIQSQLQLDIERLQPMPQADWLRCLERNRFGVTMANGSAYKTD